MNKLYLISLYTFLTFICSVTFGQTNRLTPSESNNVDELIEEEMLFQEIIGISIGIVKNGKIVYTKGYGHTDLERKIPVTTTTNFNWASISKTLTAVAAFQLIEQGKLRKSSLAKDVLKGIWTSPYDTSQIQLGHLLSHRSGIRHYNKDRGTDKKANYKAYTDTSVRSDWNARQSVAIFNDIQLKSIPGEEYRYSTFGYNLAGAMVDKVSPDGYVGHITKNILAPLDTKSIAISRKPWTAFSKNCNGAVRVWEEPEKRYVLPGGGWHSNIQDLTIFMNALINNSLLKNTSALWAKIRKDGKFITEDGYRFGLKAEFDIENNEQIVMHSGKHENVRTLMVFFPDSKLGFSIMINGGYVRENRLFRKLATLFDKPQMIYTGPLMTWEYLDDCDKDITGFWESGEESSLLRYGYEQERFLAEKDYLETKGYHLTDAEYFLRKDKLLMSGIFKKSINPTKLISPTSYNDFLKIVTQLKNQRHRLTDIEVFQMDNQVFWSGVASRQLSAPLLLRNLDSDSFKAEIDRLKSEGRFLTDFESYTINGQRKWAGLFNSGLRAEVTLLKNKEDFALIKSEMRAADFSLRALEITKVNDHVWYSGIFQPSEKGVDYRSERSMSQISKLFNAKAGESLKLIDLEKPFNGN